MNRKIIIAIILFVVTLASGCLITKVGIDTVRETKTKIQEEKNSKNIKELEAKNETLLSQEKELKLELEQEKKINNTSEKYYELENKIKKISEDKVKNEFEISKIKNGYYDNQSGINESLGSGLIFIIPGIVLFMTSFFILIIGVKK